MNPDGSTYTITDYTNTTDKTVVIPKFHNDGKTITGIGEYSFQAMGLTSVALHNAINSIGDYAFEGNELEVLYFSDYAVANANARGMVYTSGVGTPSAGLVIGDYAFANNNLTDVKLANGLTVVGDSAFENNALTAVVLPGTTKELGSKAFFSNQIAEIVLPASITSIGDYTFKSNGLSSVTFEGKLPTVLGTDIFGANDGLVLRTIAVPSGQLDIFKSAATLLGVQVSSLYDPTIPYDPTAYDGSWYDTSLNIQDADINPVSDFTFTLDSTTSTYTITSYTNTTDKTVVIPKYHSDGKPIVAIATGVFRNQGLTFVALNEGLISIDVYAFSGNQLATVIIPDSVTTIGTYAFQSNLLSSLKLSKNIAFLGAYSFENNQLKEVTIPESVSSLNGKSFANNQLTSVTFLGGVPARLPSSSTYGVFNGNTTLLTNSVKVPSAHLTSYKDNGALLGLTVSHFVGN